jgi:hypothetical protein
MAVWGVGILGGSGCVAIESGNFVGSEVGWHGRAELNSSVSSQASAFGAVGW